VLVNRVESETVKNIVGTANKRKKVQKIIAPEEGSGDSERVARKRKKVTIKMSKKKKQRTIMDSDNPYLLTQARNIIRNKEDLKELEVKKKKTKFTKDSSGKIQASPGQTIRIRIKKSEEL